MTAPRSDRSLELPHERHSERDLRLLGACEELRLVSATQLQRLCFADIDHPATRAAFARRSLGRLFAAGLLGRLERRVGGVRRGSASYVYYLAPRGQRLLAMHRGEGAVTVRRQHEPGAAYVAHTLAEAEWHVRLVEAERAGHLELLASQPEPDCWRSYLTGLGSRGWLKPDAFCVLGVGEWEERLFVEIDRATHGRPAIRRKADAYRAYHTSGQEQHAHGLFPRVLWIAPTPARCELLNEVFGRLPEATRRLFATATMDEAIDVAVRSDERRS